MLQHFFFFKKRKDQQHTIAQEKKCQISLIVRMHRQQIKKTNKMGIKTKQNKKKNKHILDTVIHTQCIRDHDVHVEGNRQRKP